jgi:hypothetical protein
MKTLCIDLPEKFRPEIEDTDGYVAFGIRCPCGNLSLILKGEREQGSSEFYGPVSIKCKNCGKDSLLFDPSRHGYDGELSQFDATFNGDNESIYQCNKCNHQQFEVGVLLEVQENESELFDNEHKNRPEDFFNSISVYCICSWCKNGSWMTSIECA